MTEADLRRLEKEHIQNDWDECMKCGYESPTGGWYGDDWPCDVIGLERRVRELEAMVDEHRQWALERRDA